MAKITLFLGTRRGLITLKKLISLHIHIANVLVLEQQPHEIDNVTKEIISTCVNEGIPYKTSKQVTQGMYAKYIAKIKPDVLFFISWRYLVPQVCFTIPKYGMFVIHDSLLPKYRGFSPTNWVIINGEKQTGITLQYISSDTDAGDIVDQIKIPLEKTETAQTLNEKLLELYPKIITNNIDSILLGTNTRSPQDSAKATYGCKRTPEDGRISFLQSTSQIVQLVRGLTYPYPGAYCFYKEKKIIIWDAQALDDSPAFVGRIPGRIIQIHNDFVDVLTIDGVLRIKSVNFENKRCKPKEIFTKFSEKLY